MHMIPFMLQLNRMSFVVWDGGKMVLSGFWFDNLDDLHDTLINTSRPKWFRIYRRQFVFFRWHKGDVKIWLPAQKDRNAENDSTWWRQNETRTRPERPRYLLASRPNAHSNLNELLRIRSIAWTRQPFSMMSANSAHLTHMLELVHSWRYTDIHISCFDFDCALTQETKWFQIKRRQVVILW